MSDLLSANLNNGQSAQQQSPPSVTIPSAASITPLGLVTFITGTVAITNIVPFTTGAHFLILIFTAATPTAFGTGGVATGSAIKNALAPTVNVPVIAVYDPVTNLYWMK